MCPCHDTKHYCSVYLCAWAWEDPLTQEELEAAAAAAQNATPCSNGGVASPMRCPNVQELHAGAGGQGPGRYGEQARQWL